MGYSTSMATEAERIIEQLALHPHPEGGYYAETFRSRLEVSSPAHEGTRTGSTAIYFLLQASDFSALHRVRSDEVWHHYAGDPLELVLIHDAVQSGSERVLLGRELARGERPQHVVPAGVWQAARPRVSGPLGFALCGCTVSPGFEFRDFELPTRAELLERLPLHTALVEEFTR